ncbi:MAG: thioredoxin fold domain-containing protein [candidate division Zixibacteria bacterium]|nr:thioredoxin fold domain-containing protein [candidate division Zixibacteria bacterium]
MRQFLTLLVIVAFLPLAGLAQDKAVSAKPGAVAKPQTTSSALVVAPAAGATAAAIVWYDFDDGLKLSQKTGKKIFLEFTAKWCGYCKRMHATTFKDPDVVRMFADNYINVSVDGDSQDTLNIDGLITTQKAMTREWKVTGYPTYWFVTPTQEKLASITGYRPKEALYDILDYMKDETYKTTKFEDFMKNKQLKGN